MGLFGSLNLSQVPIQYRFNSNCNFVVPSGNFTCMEVLVIGAGGGGGGGGSSTANLNYWGPGGAGGGGGGISYYCITPPFNANYCVVVGSAGSSGCASAVHGNNGGNGGNGGDSCFGNLVAGGGVGGQGGYVTCTGSVCKISTGGAGGTGNVCNGGNGGDGRACCNTNVNSNGLNGCNGFAGGGGGGEGIPENLVGSCGGIGVVVCGVRGGTGGMSFRSCNNNACSDGQLYGGGGGGGKSLAFGLPLNCYRGGPGGSGIVEVILHRS